MRTDYAIGQISDLLTDDNMIVANSAATGLPLSNPDITGPMPVFAGAWTFMQNSPSGREQVNEDDIPFPAATVDWEPIGSITIFRASNVNYPVYTYEFTRPITVLAGQQLIFPAGSIRVVEYNLDKQNVENS